MNRERSEGYYGRGETFPFGDNVIEVEAEEVKNMTFDCVLFQSHENFSTDQYDVLSEEQRKLPKIYLEHNPPAQHPTDSLHPLASEDVLMVHVTYYNELMWHNQNHIVKVIEHGVIKPPVRYGGEYEKGVVVINHLHQRGRRLGDDIFERVRKEVPIDLVGMGTEEYGGLGEVLHADMPLFLSKYRFFFNPIRYTSLGLSMCEAMMIGMPIVALATTEYTTVVKDGVSGFIHTDIDYLIEKMKLLLNRPTLAFALGSEAARSAQERFNIERFTWQWQGIFRLAITNDPKEYEDMTPSYSSIVL